MISSEGIYTLIRNGESAAHDVSKERESHEMCEFTEGYLNRCKSFNEVASFDLHGHIPYYRMHELDASCLLATCMLDICQ